MSFLTLLLPLETTFFNNTRPCKSYSWCWISRTFGTHNNGGFEEHAQYEEPRWNYSLIANPTNESAVP